MYRGITWASKIRSMSSSVSESKVSLEILLKASSVGKKTVNPDGFSLGFSFPESWTFLPNL